MEILVTIGYVCICVLLFSLAIAIHEWGHFFVALKLGLKVERFSIGFGPAIWKKTVNGVEYRISWIPLGGYVSIPDVDPEGTKKLEGGAAASVRARIPAWKELAVAVAGPFMNLVLAGALAFLLAAVPSARFSESEPVLDDLEEIGPAARAGLRRGDRVLSVDGVPVTSWYGLLTEVQLADGRPVAFVAVRGGVTNSHYVTPVKVKGVWTIGASAATAPVVGDVMAEGPVDKAGLKRGDRIVSFAGHAVATWSDYLDAVDAAGAAGGELVVERAGTNVTMAVKPVSTFAHLYVGPFDRPAVIQAPSPGSASEAAGLEEGDVITSFAGRPVAVWDDLTSAIRVNKGVEAEVVVRRGDREVRLRATPRQAPSGEYYLQVQFNDRSVPPMPVVRPGSPAAVAGFAAGDVIVSVDGEPVRNWHDVARAVHVRGQTGKPLKIGVRRGETTCAVEIVATPRLQYASHFYGIAAVRAAAWMSKRNPIDQIVDDGKGIFHILKALVTPRKAAATAKALGGAVMIAQGTYSSIRHDFWTGLGFLRYLNVNLAILNLLPIPVLDGGLILFALIALVFRRRVPEKIVTTLSMGFMYLLLGLMAILLWRDCSRVVTMQFQDAEAITYVTSDHDLEKSDTNAQNR
ncbi:MAG: RIP metalloprotease RseP [Kiritimatiellia bacterium]